MAARLDDPDFEVTAYHFVVLQGPTGGAPGMPGVGLYFPAKTLTVQELKQVPLSATLLPEAQQRPPLRAAGPRFELRLDPQKRMLSRACDASQNVAAA